MSISKIFREIFQISKMKKNSTLSEQYQISKSVKEDKSVLFIHKYMTAHVSGLGKTSFMGTHFPS